MRFVLGFWAVVALSTVAIMYADVVWVALPLAWLTAASGCWLQRASQLVVIGAPPKGFDHDD
jgi:hypothetical protein